ncbi:MAG TPA: transketolase [Gammaproteobacteria bacterium]|nr:transketolase [Gammaproteobacteria bacterium]
MLENTVKKQETATPSRKHLANAIRALSMDAVQKANSGHPGAPMGLADLAEVLWNDYLRHNPADPHWPNRDRFVLSNGHASMLLYSLLHLSGYDLPMEEIRQFRQFGSKTAGHPEHEITPGVETTTGPLGQGLANAVGMAIAEKSLAAEFNRDGFKVVDHYTYVIVGDGCLMEGISHEVCSLAGTLKLGKLIVFYDDNNVSIDGDVRGWYTENVPERFAGYGWHVIPNVDGHDPQAVARAIESAQAETSRATIICCKTIIGAGAPTKQGTTACHGAALGEDEVAKARQALGWPYPPFEIPQEIYDGWSARESGTQIQQEWNNLFDAYEVAHPELAARFKRRIERKLPKDWAEQCKAFIEKLNTEAKSEPTRSSSQRALEGYGPLLPELLGGSADLTSSNLTKWSKSKVLTADVPDGNYIHYGVREFGMTAMMNGMALHGGFIPYGGTFLMFSEYARNAVRMAALMHLPVIMVYSHDSIGLGEDGPTHQAVEQVATLRYVPNLDVWRPCDTVETAVAWKHMIERHDGPSAIATSRQNTAFQKRTPQQLAQIERGGYVLLDVANPEAIIMATGSEVGVAMDAARQLNEKGRRIRVVSMPATTVFDRQDAAYRESVLPSAVRKRVAIEAGVSDFWRKYVGLDGKVIGVDTFGISAPYQKLFEHFGFTVKNVTETVQSLL